MRLHQGPTTVSPELLNRIGALREYVERSSCSLWATIISFREIVDLFNVETAGIDDEDDRADRMEASGFDDLTDLFALIVTALGPAAEGLTAKHLSTLRASHPEWFAADGPMGVALSRV